MAEAGENVSCEDFALFQEVLKKMRTIDDRIVYALNTSIPTDSFSKNKNAAEECKSLYEQLTKTHVHRQASIQRCIDISAVKVEGLRKERESDNNRDNIPLLQSLRKETTKLRLMQQEMSVEEVVKDKVSKTFHERCRIHFIPPKE